MRSASLALVCLLGCGKAPARIGPHVNAVEQQALEPEVALVVPAEKNDILGLVYDDPELMAGRSIADLGEQLRDNPCADHLTRDDQPLRTHAADVWPVTDPLLLDAGLEGFRGLSTHVFFLMDTVKASFASPNEDYATCCEQEDCGAGLVSAVYEGELHLNAALVVPAALPPVILVAQTGGALGLHLHEGRSFQGVVAVELAER